MELTPTTPKPRPTRTKSSAVKTPPTTDKVSHKSTSRKAAPDTEIIESHLVAMTAPGCEDLNQRIATTAYFLAAERNFEPGRELEDWLEAERRIRTAD